MHPSQWTPIQVMTWLKFHGFKDFVDTFYSNGFDGSHLVAMQVESFGGIRNLTKERCRELIGAISRLVDRGAQRTGAGVLC